MNNIIRKKDFNITTTFSRVSFSESAVCLNMDGEVERKFIKNLISGAAFGQVPAKFFRYHKKRKGKFAKYGKSRLPHEQKKTSGSSSDIGNTYRGRVEGHRDGYAFFIPDDKNINDLFIHPENLKSAVHGDTVLARVFVHRGRKEAEIVRILERRCEEMVCVVERFNGSIRALPFSRQFKGHIGLTNGKDLNDDDVILCKIERYPSKESFAEGYAVSKLGNLRDKDIDNKIVMIKYGLSPEFPDDVVSECEHIESGNFKINKKGLTDFRNLYAVTIDGEQARDFDDAVSVFKEKGGYALYVHIADVSRFVAIGGALDREAKARGTSVYFPEFAIPMLPEVLSNGLCSLVPDEDRYAVTVKIVFDRTGEKKETSFYRSIIRSRRRLTYSYVNRLFEGALSDDDALMPFLQNARELSDILLENRDRRGVIEFDMPEAEFIFDDSGNITDINPADRGYAERMIECFMIAANEAAAEYFHNGKIKSIYRVHDEPAVRKIEEWIMTAKNFGLSVPCMEYPVTSEYAARLSKIALKSKHADLLNSLLIRSMMRAEYSVENTGHFGLASSAYTHFTSPIRRYPDLAVHRALLYSLGLGCLSETKGELKELAALCSVKEREAAEAEHDIGVFKKLQYISARYDDVFEGYINRVTAAGIFVYIEKLLMTGYVDYGNIDFDDFRKSGKGAVGKNTSERYRIGDRVLLKPVRLDITAGMADFTIYKKKPKR